MAAKAKRWNPTPSEVLGAIQTPAPGQATAGTIVGTARKTAGATGLQQLGGALARFNPVLQKYMVGRENRGMEEADQYYREMEQGVSANAYEFKTGLRKAGYSQWRNPHVYRNQIMNIAGITAYKDADFLRTDKGFLADIEEAKKGDNFAHEAEQIAEAHLAANRQRQPTNPKEGGYWDAGYAPKWMEARQRLLSSFLNEKVAGDRREVLENFYENARNHLLDVIKTNQPNFLNDKTGKRRQHGDPINIKKLRDYISEQWKSYPDDDHSFNQAVFQKVIQPVFMDLAEDPDNDLLIDSIYERVMKMTRETPKGGKHSMFNRFTEGTSEGGSEASGRGGFLDSDSFRSKLFDVAATAHHKQWNREQDERKVFTSLIELRVKDRANNKLAHIPWPYDEQGKIEAAAILAEDEEFMSKSKYIRKGGDLHTQLVFRDIVEEVGRAVYSLDLNELKDRQLYGEKIQEKIQASMSPYLKQTEYYGQIQQMFREAVGGATSLDQAKVAAMKLLNPEALVNRFVYANPTFRPEMVGVSLALSVAVEKAMDHAALARQNDLIQIASNVASGRNKITDPFELLAELRDAQNETFDSEDDEAVGRAIKMVENHTQITGNWEDLERDKSEILTSVIDGGTNSLLKEIIAPQFYHKFKQAVALDDQAGVDLMKPSSIEKEAAHKTFDEMESDMQLISRKLLNRYHIAHPDPTEREKHWKDSGAFELKKTLVEEMRSRAGIYARTYTDHLRWSQEGQAKAEAEQIKTLGTLGKNAEKVITSIEGQIESHLREIGGVTNQKIFEDNHSQSGAGSAAQFWTGQSGYTLRTALRQQQENRHEALWGDNGAVKGLQNELHAYRKAQADGDVFTQEALAPKIKASQLHIRNMLLHGGSLDWKKWVDEKGELKQGSDLNLNVTIDGEELDIPFNMVEHKLSANTHLLVNSWDEFDDISNEINAAEAFRDLTDMPDAADGESVPLDKFQGGQDYEFSPKAKGFFRMWEIMHGTDINPLNYDVSDPKQKAKLAEAHADYDQKWRGQMVKFMARKPNDLPEAASAHIEEHTVAEFLGSDDPEYQNTSWTEGEKGHFDRFLQHNQRMLNDEFNIEDGLSYEGYSDLMDTITNGQASVYRYEVVESSESGEQLGTFGKWWKDFTLDLDGNMLGRATGRLPTPPTYYSIQSGKQRDGVGTERSLSSEVIGPPELGDVGDALTGKKFTVDNEYNSQRIRAFGKVGDIEKTQERLDELGLDFNAVPRRDRVGQQHIMAQHIALAEMNYSRPTDIPDMEQFWVPFGRSTSGSGLKIDPQEFKKRTEHYIGVLSGGPEMNTARAKAFNLVLKRSNFTKTHYGQKENVFGIAPLSIPHKKSAPAEYKPRTKSWGEMSQSERLHERGDDLSAGSTRKTMPPEEGATISPAGFIQPRVEQMPPDAEGGLQLPTRLTPDAPWVHEEEKKKIVAPIQNPKQRAAVAEYLDMLFPDRVTQRTADVLEDANKREAERYRTSPKGAAPKADALPTVPEIIKAIQDDTIQKLIDKLPKPKIPKPKPKPKPKSKPRSGLTSLEFGKGIKKGDKK